MLRVSSPSTSQSFFKSAIPIISLSSGNIGNNGALTAITALATTYSGGAWCLYPAGAIATGIPAAPTFYWTVFSSTTAGTVFNNIMPATGFPTPPASPTPFVTTGPGAFVGNTTTTILLTVPIPGGVMGANGQLRITVGESNTSSGGTKNEFVKLGTAVISSVTWTTSTYSVIFSLTGNVNAQNSQKTFSDQINSGGAGGLPPAYSSIDTSTAQNITFNITNNTATDNFVLEDVLIELIPG